MKARSSKNVAALTPNESLAPAPGQYVLTR
jgi:hypothetical protein